MKKPPEGDGDGEKGKVTDKVEGKAGVRPIGEKKWGEKGDKEDAVDKKEEKSQEEQDIEAELNAILKRSPSKLRYFALLIYLCCHSSAMPSTSKADNFDLRSNHLLKILLPLLKESKGRLREVQHNTSAFHC